MSLRRKYPDTLVDETLVASLDDWGMSPEEDPSRNGSLLIRALATARSLELLSPGTYRIANPSDAESVLSFPSDTTLRLGAGVRLLVTDSKSFAVNSNYKSNAFVISGQASAPESPTNVWLQELTCSGHPFVVGDYVLIKGDSSRKNVGVFQVAAVTASTFSVYRYGGAPTAPTGSPVAYKANARMRIVGDGVIDLGNHSVNVNLRAMGLVWNKVADSEILVPIVGCPKYAVYASNFHRLRVRASGVRHQSDALHLRGPGYGCTVEDLTGETSDDPLALVTYDPSYQGTDEDATVNNNGEIIGVEVLNLCMDAQQTRAILIAPSNSGDVRNVHINRLAAHTGSQNVLLQLGIPAGHAGKVCGLQIDSICGNPPQGKSLVLLEDGAGTLNVEGMRIGSIVAGDAVASAGVTASPVYFGTATGTTDLSIGHASVEADCAGGAVSFGVFEAIDGSNTVTMGNVTVRATGTTRQVAAVRGSSTASIFAAVANLIQFGGQQAVCNFTGSGTFELALANWRFNTNGDSGSVGFAASQSCQIKAANLRVLGSGFSGLFNFFGSSKTHDVAITNAEVNGNGFANLGTSNQLNIALAGGRFTGGGSLFNTYGTTADIRLTGDIAGAACSIDGTKLNATSTNHALGAKFYNNAAGFGAGVGAYVNGAAAWTRVAA